MLNQLSSTDQKPIVRRPFLRIENKKKDPNTIGALLKTNLNLNITMF